MDSGLVAWARRVKRGRIPPLWLFTDEARLPDPLPAIAQLPPGRAGVVFRHDSAPGRAELGAKVAKACRARRLALLVAGDARLAAGLQAGLHLRGGRRGLVPVRGLVSSSVHDITELARAKRAGARLLFISPVFPTSSHPGSKTLGPHGWRRLARHCGTANPFALGGIDGASIRRLGRACGGAGAIGALVSLP